jgi:hypothetical protein
VDPFDKSRCSFPVPDFKSEGEELDWMRSLTTEQGLELVHWMRVYRWGEDAVNQPMDRTAFQMMTMEEFRAMKRREELEEQHWQNERGLPPRYSSSSLRTAL